MTFEPKRFDKHDPNHELDFKEAKDYYDKMVMENHPYVYLIFSNDWFSEGYWVESHKPNLKNLNGYIIEEYDRSVNRDSKINLIINEEKNISI